MGGALFLFVGLVLIVGVRTATLHGATADPDNSPRHSGIIGHATAHTLLAVQFLGLLAREDLGVLHFFALQEVVAMFFM